jgi:hypothetical protein
LELLLRAKADVSAQGGKYDYTLRAAVQGGHEKVVEQLLLANADVNARRGYEKIVEMMLLENGRARKQMLGRYLPKVQLQEESFMKMTEPVDSDAVFELLSATLYRVKMFGDRYYLKR